MNRNTILANPNYQISLWKDNKTDQQWSITAAEAVAKFKQSKFHEYWEKAWPMERALLAFFGASESDGGLQSVFDSEKWNDIFDELRTLLLQK